MIIEIFLTVTITAIIQSIFGLGVLLFGTPILLALGYNFYMILSVLLPISIFINLLQLKKNFDKIDYTFYRRLLVFSVPFTVMSLILVSLKNIDINLFVGMFLILLSIKNRSTSLKKIFKNFLRYEKIYLIVLGILHGFSNLGGALLSGVVLSKTANKESKRSTIAICYLTLAIFQIIALVIAKKGHIFLKIDHIIYFFPGFMIYFVSNKFIFFSMSELKFKIFSDFFLFFVGLLLLINI